METTELDREEECTLETPSHDDRERLLDKNSEHKEPIASEPESIPLDSIIAEDRPDDSSAPLVAVVASEKVGDDPSHAQNSVIPEDKADESSAPFNAVLSKDKANVDSVPLNAIVADDRADVTAEDSEGEPRVPTWRQVRGELCQRSVLTFTMFYSLCLLLHYNTSSYMLTQVTSLEREFGLTSLQSGQLLSASEVGYLCLVLPASYLSARLHVPRASTLTFLLVGVAGVLLGLPHFIFPATHPRHGNGSVVNAADVDPALCWALDETEDDRCDSVTSQAENATGESSGGSNPDAVYSDRTIPVFVYLCVLQAIRGAIGSVRMPMFTEYIESNAKKTDTGFYIGIMAAISILGPGIAFLAGGAISKLHVSLQPTDMTPTHPDWVGAWWLGFVVFGSLATVSPAPLWFFPRHFHTRGKRRSSRRKNSEAKSLKSHSGRRGSVREQASEQGRRLLARGLAELKSFLQSILRLLLNPAFFFMVLAYILFGFAMTAIYVFMPKYMQHQFNIPAWKANYIIGGGELTMGSWGFFVGGWLSRRLKADMRAMYRLTISLTVVCVANVLLLMLLSCPQPQLVGAPGGSEELASNCSLPCACPNEVFPVCDRDAGVTYFSPCHAGCSVLEGEVYKNCSCSQSPEVHPGLCPTHCLSVYFFSIAFYVFLFVISLTSPMSFLISIRCVPNSQSGMAIGSMSFATGIIGLLLGPILFGGLIDTFCWHWNKPCGVKGQCSVYDNDRFRVHINMYSMAAVLLCALCLFLSYLSYSRCKKPSAVEADSRTDGEVAVNDEDT